MTGKSVSHFEIVEKLGEGGSGVVYKARDVRLDRFVALKFLSPHLLDSEDALRRFLQEARAISALNHPNIATIYEVDEWNGERFLVLEYLPGGTLRSRIRDLRAAGLRFPLSEVLDYGLQVADGLAYAHRHGIVHRDIKPANIMYAEAHKVKIADFGLAKYLGGDLSKSGILAGTVPYMSPEQAMGHRVDHRSDIYSFGVVLYEMAAGRRPFDGPHEAGILHAIVHDRFPSIRRSCPELPAAFEQIVRCATAKEPARRYQSMEELAKDLRSVQASTKTSDGPSRTATISESTSFWRPLWGRAAGVLAAALLVAIVLSVARTYWPTRCRWAPDLFAACQIPAERHVGILPFDNLGRDEPDRVLFAGLHDLLSTNLGQLARFDKSLCVHAINDAEEASRVRLAVTGRLERAGPDLVRIAVNLSNPRTRLPLREFVQEVRASDISFLQDELVVRIADMLGVRLDTRARVALASGGTLKPDAFAAYLRGLGYLDHNKNVDNAIVSFENAIKLDHSYALAYAGLGEACRRKFDRTKDRRWIGQARENCEHAINDLNYRQEPAFTTLGLVFWDARQFEAAIEACQRALDLNPLSIDARGTLAKAYQAVGKLKQAELAYQQGVDLRPSCYLAHHNLGRFYLDTGRFREADIQFRLVTELTPNSPRVYHNLGVLYGSASLYEKAAAMFRKSLAIKERAITYSNLGTIYLRLGCNADAVRMMERAKELGQDQYLAWGNLAEAYLTVAERKELAPIAFDKAIELAKRELARRPNDPDILRALANYYARLGEKNEALATIDRARQLAPANVNVLYRVAEVYEMVGMRDPALEALKQALEAGYETKDVCASATWNDLHGDPRFQKLVEGGCSRAIDLGTPTGQAAKGCPADSPPG